MRAHPGLAGVGLAVLCVIFSVASEAFLTWGNVLNILTASAVMGILAIGAAFVIGAGGIDLSVGAVMALSAVAGVLAVPGTFPAAAGGTLVLCLATGLGAGAVNGYLIGGVKLPAFIVTLGMLSLARGLALIFSEGKPVYGLPEPLVFLGQGRVLGVPIPVLAFLILGVCGHVALNRTAFGRYCKTIGDNERACRNAGIRIARHKIALYAFSGALASIAGMIAMGRVNAADPAAGMMYELNAITAAVIGGASLSGGRASVFGAVLGALLMSVLQNGMTLMNMPSYYQLVGVGAVLILAVAFGQWRGGHAAAR